MEINEKIIKRNDCTVIFSEDKKAQRYADILGENVICIKVDVRKIGRKIAEYAYDFPRSLKYWEYNKFIDEFLTNPHVRVGHIYDNYSEWNDVLETKRKTQTA